MDRGPASDDTVILPSRRARPRRTGRVGIVLAALLAVLAGAVWLWQRPAPFPLASEHAILHEQPTDLTITRFAPDPAILVLDFASMTAQGEMLDRVAMLVEKAGMPRDRVLSWHDARAAIAAGGDTIATYYYGHDYRAADLVRFFTLARQENRTLSRGEQRLRALLSRLGWTAGTNAALISIPALSTTPAVSLDDRRTILHHELSHGEYFTNPAYAHATQVFWQSLSHDDRARFRRFLGSEGYDTGDADLMANETQAYLMHTPDPRFFNAALVNLTPDAIAGLQSAFRAFLAKNGSSDRLQ